MDNRTPAPELLEFLEPYNENIQNLALDLRKQVIEWIPAANELVYDAYNAVSMAFSLSDKLSDAFCHIAVYPDYVNFGFNRGTELTNATVRLSGSGQLIRHLTVRDMSDFPAGDIHVMVQEALKISERRIRLIASHIHGQTFINRSAGKKKRPENN
ncbi:hypothetical protein [Fulvivirga sedimenti]|uniref:YdhG-like domain-containing protein n=1 Tax=Fulvivirga sedimenti TaxID=2879465 RepID=A0A9X1KZ37_9BACT|nr:hypothetical protein [Fulvivirga sedimenti]MCA6074266.1 hypothetical protein [Fulvivirga sedimenti]